MLIRWFTIQYATELCNRFKFDIAMYFRLIMYRYVVSIACYALVMHFDK